VHPGATLRDRTLHAESRASVRNWFRARREILGTGDVTVIPKSARGAVFQVVIFLAAFLVIFSRRPDAILNAQFFAEDGKLWYADAYRFGLRSLLFPADGYLHTVARLTALVTLIFPFSIAPLVMNLCAITFQALPVNVFLSSRFSTITLSTRLLAGFLYLALPNTDEINANAATLQWHLALLACLLLLAEPTRDRKWRFFDAVVLVLISLEGPMGILFVPLAAVLWWMRQDSWGRISLALLAPGAVVQAVTVLLSHTRQSAPNGASISRLTSILGRQVFLSSLLGKETVLHIVLAHYRHSSFFEMIATTVGLAFLLYALRCAPTELKLFILFAFSVFALSLVHPLADTPDHLQWESLRIPGCGTRYYFLPMIAFLSALLWTISSAKTSLSVRWFAGVLLLLLPIGILRDWQYPGFADLHFREYASKFEGAPSGTRIVIPLNPIDPAYWSMELTKH